MKTMINNNYVECVEQTPEVNECPPQVGNNFYSVTLTYPPFPGKGTISGHPPKNPKKPGFWGSRNPLSILRFFILPPPPFCSLLPPLVHFWSFQILGSPGQGKHGKPPKYPFFGVQKRGKKGHFLPFFGVSGKPRFWGPPILGVPPKCPFLGFFAKKWHFRGTPNGGMACFGDSLNPFLVIPHPSCQIVMTITLSKNSKCLRLLYMIQYHPAALLPGLVVV